MLHLMSLLPRNSVSYHDVAPAITNEVMTTNVYISVSLRNETKARVMNNLESELAPPVVLSKYDLFKVLDYCSRELRSG